MSEHVTANGLVATLEPAELAQLAGHLRAENVASFSRRSGASVAALTRALAGLPVRRGTLVLIRLALDAQAPASSPGGTAA